MNSRKLIAVATAILMASASAFAAVKNGASLKGTEYTKGGNNAKGGGVIAWNSYSSLDPTAFSHDLTSSDLTVLKDGDYLVAFTVPLSTINSQRNTHRADLLVNGTAAPTGVGESSYIRFAGGHNESSDHFAGLVSLKANDVLTVKTTPTAQNGGESFIGTCSLYAELVEGDRNVFSATATEIQSGVELNVEPDIGDQGLVWTSTRKGSGYTHSDGEAGITIKDDGNYMVYANVPLRGNVARGSVGLTITLDDEYIWGARGQQGYIRNANDHKDASIHFSGMIRAEAGQVLTVITEQLAAAGSITVQADRAASIFIEKVRNDGLFSDSFTDTTAGENLNPDDKTALSLVGDGESLDIIDNLAYSNEGDSEENIVIKKAGSYLLSFNSTFTGGNARANPRVTVEVNGSVVPGATSLSHYNRHASGHDEVTGSFVALLSDLAVDDVVTVSVQREGNGGIVTSPEGGRVVLQAKAASEIAAGTPPRFSSFSGGLSGFSAILDDSGLKLDAATLKATLNGEAVDVTVDSANGVNAISYAFADFPPTGSEHALNFAFNDTGGNAHSKDFAFTVTTQYQTISPAVSMSDVNKDKGGFRVNMTQISVIQTEGPVEIHGNSWVNAEKQIRGEYLNPNEVDDDDNPLPYLNEADPDAWEGWSITPVDVDYVNMNQDEGGNIGNFGEDQMFPNIPGWGDSTDGIVGEFLTVLHLKKGFQTLGVNSDDGFSATIGTNFQDIEAQQIGLFNGNRGAADSLFNIVVTEEGYYPLRVLWWEGNGGANIEIFSVVDGVKVLVNDPDNENAIKAYNIGNSTGRAAVVSIMPTPGKKRVESTSSIEVVIENGSETTVDQSSVKMTLNGKDVDVDVSKSGDIVTISYTGGLAAEAFCCAGVENTAIVSFKESNGNERSREWSFDVQSTNRPGAAGTLIEGLIGHWPLDEGSGTTAANTVSGGSDAELHNGVEWVDDPDRGMVLSFDGVDGYADAGAETIHQMTQDNDFTWSVWINQGSGNGPNNVVLGNRYSPEGGDFAPREFIKFTPTKFEFHLDGGGQNCEYDDLANSEGEWVHYVVVKTGNTLTHYSHGEVGESSTFTSELQNPQPFYFGGDQTSECWNGMLDDIAIWDRALSAAEVADLTSGGIPVPVQVVPGLIAYWNFDEKSGELASDSGHNSNLGTLVNFEGDDSQWVAGKLGGAIDFNGSNYVEVPHDPSIGADLVNGFSVSAWFNSNVELAAGGSGNRMLEKGNSYFFLQGVGSGGMNFLVKKGGVNKTATTGETIDAGEWNHIVGVFDGENAIVYLNGEQKGSIAVPAPVDDAGLPLRIGSDDSGNFFDGAMDDVGIWDRPITPDEVSLIYNHGAGAALISAGAPDKTITAPAPDLVDISQPGDAVVASSDNSPGGEQASNAIDDNDQTKYLNFDGANNNASGLTITTAGGVVTGLGLTSANDAGDRDPATFVLSGSNDGGATLTEIASGDVPAFGARFERQEVRFANDAAYTTYELIFPTTTGPSTCCMQIAEIELLGTPTVPIVSNGSFEADDVPEWPGYGAITGWTGGSGINDGGPFGDNGVIPDGAKLGFIQGTKALSQQLTGLEAGAEYVLAFYYNARNCCGGTIGFTVSVGGEELGSVSDVEPVGGENAYNSASYNFVAAGTEAELVFSATAAGDATLLLDAVSVSRAGEGPVDTPALSIVNNGDGTVTVTFEGKLQGASTVNGPWADVEGAVSPQIIPASEAMQYARAVSE